MAPGIPQSVSVVVQKQATGFGFTPFKYSLADAARKKKKMNFTELLRNCDQSQVGLPVQAVDAQGPASTSGVQAWDVITHVNGTDVTAMKGKEVIDMIKQIQVGQSMQLTMIRSANPPPAPVLKPVGSFSDIFRRKTKA